MMGSLTGARVLDLWEAGRALHPLDRAVLLASAALPEHAVDSIADLPVGARDAAILRLRAAATGDRVDAIARCPACQTQLEFAISIRALLAANEPVRDAGPAAPFRLPTSQDLAAVIRCCLDGAPAPAASELLAARCCNEAGVTAADAEHAARELADFVASADPLADIRVGVTCTACSHSWDEAVDPAALLWSELECQAAQLMRDVARLANAFAWREQEILAMSPLRRRAYLELL